MSNKTINLGHVDKPVCPKCGKRDYNIIDYGVSDKQELGMYWFKVRCKNCKQKFKYYKDLD
ncbi:hypothetical protein [Thermoanaerobacterium thermosaccharolyticum]|uniref:hypothetical protein n=1 Tax=Thermoanaerobacterium thermosaccharolyticum TaxID=1517 RepID=UPI002FD8B2A5